jgi:AcrR family transcriptional regulator
MDVSAIATTIRADGAGNGAGAAGRSADILDIAEAMVRRSAALPLPLGEIGEAMGVSRSLVYAYYPDSDTLIAALLGRHLDALDGAGLSTVVSTGALRDRATGAAALYLRHVADRGNVIHNILRDVPHGVCLSPATVMRRNRLLRPLAAAARQELRLTPHEAITLVEILAAIPEDLGRSVHRGDLGLEGAIATCERLVSAAIDGLRPV